MGQIRTDTVPSHVTEKKNIWDGTEDRGRGSSLALPSLLAIIFIVQQSARREFDSEFLSNFWSYSIRSSLFSNRSLIANLFEYILEG